MSWISVLSPGIFLIGGGRGGGKRVGADYKTNKEKERETANIKGEKRKECEKIAATNQISTILHTCGFTKQYHTFLYSSKHNVAAYVNCDKKINNKIKTQTKP